MRSRLGLALAVVAALLLPGQGLAALPAAAEAVAPVASHPVANSLADPLGISGAAPRLGWQVAADRRGLLQSAYQVRVASTEAALAAPDVWDSGKVTSAQSVDVVYGGPALTTHTRYVWSVRVWDEAGTPSGWSAPASFETGLLAPADWTASWVGAGADGIPADWTDYTVAFTATFDNALGVYFRGADSNNAYMWQISESQRALRPHVKRAGVYTVLPATPFPAGFDFSAQHDYSVQVLGQTITTLVDGVQLDQRNDPTFTAPGLMGFRTSGDETGVVRRVKVTGHRWTVRPVVRAEDVVLLETEFPAGDSHFPAATVTPDGLRVDRNGGEAWLVLNPGVPALRKDFTVPTKTVRSARIYASAQGVYRLHLNGQRVGDHELAPGWTDYNKRIQYQTYDVTNLVTSGANAIGAELSGGWFAGKIAMFGDKKYGRVTAVIAQLRIEYTDGSVDVVGTDSTWRTTASAVTAADLLDGETYDARRAALLGAWTRSGYDASAWDAAVVRPSATARLEPQDDQPVRVTQELGATALPSPTPGTYVYDLGQNMVGKVRLTLTGSPGRVVRIRHAEVLNPDGSIYVANLRGAKATDQYIFATSDPETWSPAFTQHGFRYVELTGLDTAPPASAVTGVVMGTDGAQVSSLDTSSALVDQLHSNIVWGQRGNFLSVPTDTPARDERMGWTGDINVFARTAVYNLDSQAFLNKWLQDLRDTQRTDGAFPGVAPTVPNTFDGGYGYAGWADAGVNVPWTLWQAYGDTNVITENYAAMKKYVDYLQSTSTNGIRNASGYLDWLNLDDPTPADVLCTAFVAKSTRQFAQMAAAVGNTADAAAYMQRYNDVRTAYQNAFISADGTVKGDSQTAYIITITNDLVPADRRAALTGQFVETIQRRDWHLSTGFLGVDGLLPALTAVGRTDVAYILLQNSDYPSWGYEIGKGATTIWERWNSIAEDGSFGPVEMNSFNHYAYGAVGEWMYRTLAGVSALEPGYRRLLIAPQPGAGITSADFTYQTRYGTVRSAWVQEAAGIRLDATVPGGTSAVVRIPADTVHAVVESGSPLSSAPGISDVVDEGSTVSMTVGSGSYSFSIDPAATQVGRARDAAGNLSEVADDLVSAGALTPEQHEHVADANAQITAEVDQALAMLVDDRAGAAAHVHAALALTQSLQTWLAGQTLAPEAATELGAAAAAVADSLSAASAYLLGVSAKVTAGIGPYRPGDEVPVTVTLTNAVSTARPGTSLQLTAPAGWQVEPSAPVASDLPAGGTATLHYVVRPPATALVGANTLTATIGYVADGTTVRVPTTGTVDVLSPVDVTATMTSPASGEPGTQTTVAVTVANMSSRTVTGRLDVTPAAGWVHPLPSPPVSLLPGTRATVHVDVAVPLTSEAEEMALTARFVDATQALSSSDVTFTVVQSMTPAGAMDYVDLGEPASESAHNVVGGPGSGTSVEAGRTRRYSNASVADSWFEFDLAHVPGQPFVLRAVETYDGPQRKLYRVSVDGTEVLMRDHRGPGAGLETYQVLVDQPALLTDASVRVRMQRVGTAFDPSIADVWSLPVPSDLPAPTVTAELDPAVPDGEQGWFGRNVAITLRGQDYDGQPVTSLSYAVDGGEPTAYGGPVQLSADGVHEIVFRGTDGAGRTSADRSVHVRVDLTAPTVAGQLSGARSLTVTSSDATSGLAYAEHRTDGGAWTRYADPVSFDRSAHRVEIRAVDLAGNVSPVVTVDVPEFRYTFSGFAQPINDPAVAPGPVSVFRAGDTIPVRFTLRDGAGTEVQSPSMPTWMAPERGATVRAQVNEKVGKLPASSVVTWDAAAKQYVFNWQTARAMGGSYWRIGVRLDDGTTHLVTVALQ